ncbi:hypothetical protein M5D96_005852 [Drosophila gunungcola]|uniref:Uncharacterized protein n=1 Tax=Drosophila gunungcola TaxID=103775 RepID=A0A9Q0BR65_9MUSC|nr:hypothetical protein M5D96_005852 [Drosophila gunungcola]
MPLPISLPMAHTLHHTASNQRTRAGDCWLVCWSPAAYYHHQPHQQHMLMPTTFSQLWLPSW